MKRQQLFLVGISLLFFTLSFNSFAFDKFSHRLICQLAFQNLSQDEQVVILDFLKAIPQQHKLLINRYNHQKSDNKINFSEACTWADAIKKAKFTKVLSKKYASAHYINIPRNTHKITAKNIQKNCSNGCIINAINMHYKQVTSLPNSWQKTQALLFLGHWLGDIHQPLHVSFASDRGGNKTKVTGSKCKTLHWFWDSCLLQSQHKSFKQQLIYLQTLWQRAPDDENKKSLQENTIIWANESFSLVKKESLGYCYISQGSCIKNKSSTKINTEYLNTHIPIIELQIVKASKRLHTLLKFIVQK